MIVQSATLSGGLAINKMQGIKGKEIGKPMKSPLTQEVTATTCTLQNLIYNAIKNPVIQQKLVKYLKDNPKRIPVHCRAVSTCFLQQFINYKNET